MKIEVEIYGYKRGHEDTYEIELTQEMLIFHNTENLKKAKCHYREDNSFQWLGLPNHSLEHILESENIHVPSVLPRLLEIIFLEWKNKQLNTANTQLEIKETIKYLNWRNRKNDA